MSNQPVHPSPPPVPSSPPSGTVRRHHTISASSRAARTASRIAISDDAEQAWNEDELVDQERDDTVGAVGEKSSLHRQASLPTRYNRVFQRSSQVSRQPGSLTPRALNSLTAIAAEQDQDVGEHDWEQAMREFTHDEDNGLHHQADPGLVQQQFVEVQGASHSPMSPHFAPVPSPPPAASNIRRHQSLTYGTAGAPRRVASNLKRSGTLQAQVERPGASPNSPSPPEGEEEFVEEDPQGEENYQYANYPSSTTQNQYQGSPLGPGRSSPWGATSNEWRLTPNVTSGNSIDDVQKALAGMDISNQHVIQTPQNYQVQSGIGQPPRFTGSSGFQQQANTSQPPVSRRGDGGLINGQGMGPRSSKLSLVTDVNAQGGPASASASVPQIGQTIPPPLPMPQRQRTLPTEQDKTNNTWDIKDRTLVSKLSNPNMHYNYGGSGGIPPNPPIPAQYLNQQANNNSRLGLMTSFGQSGSGQIPGSSGLSAQSMPGFLNSPIDVPSLIATKGYNPTDFDLRPPSARYFVIKSYTEDDVHKSLKYEIWSSTDPGNKRLDKAFKDAAGRGPIYLFFSVNASGHFCGMAEMLTPVDYTRSSTVWASDKWKGVFKVRWIFVRDIPNATLRHIRLNNTQERKPVTNSRDTQELLPEAGQEMLRIFCTHPAKTSLLQDFAFYELQSMQKMQQQIPGSPSQTPGPIRSPQPQMSPQLQQQAAFNMANQYSIQAAMNPIMQMQLNSMNMGGMNNMNTPYSQQTVQNIMRERSPMPVGQNVNYMGLGNGF